LWADIEGFKDKGSKGRIARFFLGDDDQDNSNKNKSKEIEENRPAVNAGEDESEETPDDVPGTTLLALRTDPASRIANPVVRFLHKQAHGDALPVYGGLENRQALLDEISSHVTSSQ
jgi:hypothetical protein